MDVVVKCEYMDSEMSQHTKRQTLGNEQEPDSSDSESVHSETRYPSNSHPPQVARKQGGGRTSEHVSIARETEDQLADWLHEHPLFYDKCDADFKDTAKRNKLMEKKAAEFGLTGAMLNLWYRNMRTVYSRQMKACSNQSASSSATRLTARKQWTVQKFAFLKDHISARSYTRTIRKVASPIEEIESDAGSSVSESPSSQTVAAAQQHSCRSQPAVILADVNGKWTVSRDQPSVGMANGATNSNVTALEVISQPAESVSSNVRQLFGTYLIAEMERLTEEQFYSFQAESLAILSALRQARHNTSY